MTLDELLKQATPLPWDRHKTRILGVFAGVGTSEIVQVLGPNRADQLEMKAANAALIAHCVNNFAQLVEALEKCRAALKNLHEVQRWDKNIEELGDCIDEAVDAEDAAHIALAAAQTIQQPNP